MIVSNVWTNDTVNNLKTSTTVCFLNFQPPTLSLDKVYR